MSSILTEIKINELLLKYPFVENFFNENMIDIKEIEMLTFNEYLNMITEEQIEDKALNIEKLKAFKQNLKAFFISFLLITF